MLSVRQVLSLEYCDMCLRLSREARKNNYLHVAQWSLGNLDHFLDKQQKRHILGKQDMTNGLDVRKVRFESQYEGAKVMWSSNEKPTAVSFLKDLAYQVRTSELASGVRGPMHPRVLNKLGRWGLELRSDSAADLHNNYFEKSVELYQGLSPTTDVERAGRLSGAYGSLAQFCDGQYQQIDTHMKSKEFEEKAGLIKCLEAESSSIKSVGAKANNNRDVRRAAIIMERQSALDLQEHNALSAQKACYLEQALTFYAKALQQDASGGTSHDLRVFRLVSLWFSNMGDTGVNNLLEKELPQIPSHKFTGKHYKQRTQTLLLILLAF